ncbi:hypothetical protein [Neobacillus mesonae]|uniref:Uncharacterized protein n=1 Tax=Neobacillus mesonae TaxID=1193713 RepID=A0A3Q9QSR7_9BACI|nr:hypothetical protein [Neobacillus mesonae]AZU60534.1 hypothetical protein CHR53_04225 [Neobacillus mesonae]
MKYQYSVVDDPNSIFRKIKLPDELLVIEFLLFDMESFREPIFIDCLNRVLSGESFRECIGGNICSLEVGKVHTKVTNLFITDGMQESCMIETIALKKIIEIWITENKEVLR